MSRLLLARAAQAVVVLALMSFAIYGLMGLMPGDPIDLMISANPHATSADAERLRALYGLDKPLIERYGNWLMAALGGDFGYSRLFARPVLQVLPAALGNTLALMGTSLLLSVAVALPLGAFAATRPRGLADGAINLTAFAGISVPVFWLALLLILLFSVRWGVLPANAVPTEADAGFWLHARHMALPVATLAIASIGGHTRYVRAAMIEVLRQDYVRTARAKGVGSARVVLKHALRNALIPLTTIVALDFGFLFSGALVTETIFALPGMGKTIYDSIMGNDYNLAMVALLFATFVTLLGNLLADLAYAWLDPRISYR